MRIAYLANIRLPTEKAHGVQIMNMCGALAEAGAKVELLVPATRTAPPDEIFSYYGLEKNFSIVRLPVPSVPLWLWGGFPLQLFLIARAFKKYAKKKSDIGAIYTRGEMILFIYRFAARHGIKLVWETHIKPANIRLYAKAARSASLVVAITKKYATEISALWAVPSEKILYAPDGVSLKPFEHMPSREEARQTLRLPLNKKLVTYTGSDLPWKGLRLLREASEFLPDDCVTVFVGDIKETMPASPRRIFAGAQAYTAMPSWLAAADVLVLTGDPASEVARYYTSPLKLFEYMAANRPVVATDLPATRDVLSDEIAYLAEPTAEGLANAIKLVLENPHEGEARASIARQKVEQYTWESRARAILTASK